MSVAVSHKHGHLSLVADAERVHRLGEIAPQHHTDALALEETAHHQGFTLVATAPYLGECGGGRRAAGATVGTE